MERYIGLDVHAASCTLAVISQSGRRLRDFPVETNGQARSRRSGCFPARSISSSKKGCRVPGSTNALSARRGDRGRGHHGESGPEERRTGCVWPGREAAVGNARQADLQGSPTVHATARALPDSPHAGRGCGSCAVADQESLPGSWHRDSGRGRLPPAPPRAVAETAGIRGPVESDAALRAPRLPDRAEGASRGRSAAGIPQAPRSSRSWRPRLGSGRSEAPDWFRSS